MTMLIETVTDELAAIAEPLRRSTVQVRSRHSGIGSGVIWSADGIIISNAHVVRGSEAEIELSDRRVLRATVTNRNPQRDLVALQVNATDLPAAPIGNSDALRTGELVLAIGNPLGLTGAVTMGIIHSVSASDQPNWIQTDLQLAPGNSGGPLADVYGRVIGINTMIVGQRGFAVPSTVIQRFLQEPSDRPYLGVTLQPVSVSRDRRRATGLLITEVEADSPAAAAQLQLGDVIIGTRSRPFQDPSELFQILENSQVGDGLPLLIMRAGQQIVADVVLCSRASQTTAA